MTVVDAEMNELISTTVATDTKVTILTDVVDPDPWARGRVKLSELTDWERSARLEDTLSRIEKPEIERENYIITELCGGDRDKAKAFRDDSQNEIYYEHEGKNKKLKPLHNLTVTQIPENADSGSKSEDWGLTAGSNRYIPVHCRKKPIEHGFRWGQVFNFVRDTVKCLYCATEAAGPLTEFDGGRLAAEIDYARNIERLINIKLISQGSGVRVSWVCSNPECGHKWEAEARSRTTKNSGCPECGQKNRIAKRTGQGRKTLKDTNPKVHALINRATTDFDPDTVGPSSHRKANFICRASTVEHDVLMRVDSMVQAFEKYRYKFCPVCRNEENLLKNAKPELYKRLDSKAFKERYPDRDMETLTIGEETKVPIICKKEGHLTWRSLKKAVLFPDVCVDCKESYLKEDYPDIHSAIIAGNEILKKSAKLQAELNLAPPTDRVIEYLSPWSHTMVPFWCKDCREVSRVEVASKVRGDGCGGACRDNSKAETLFVDTLIELLGDDFNLVARDRQKVRISGWLNGNGNSEMQIDCYGKLSSEYTIAFEYDGNWHTKNETVINRDIRKTICLLDNGTIVIRVRSNCDFVEIGPHFNEKNLLQFNWKHNNTKTDIEEFMDSTILPALRERIAELNQVVAA